MGSGVNEGLRGQNALTWPAGPTCPEGPGGPWKPGVPGAPRSPLGPSGPCEESSSIKTESTGSGEWVTGLGWGSEMQRLDSLLFQGYPCLPSLPRKTEHQTWHFGPITRFLPRFSTAALRSPQPPKQSILLSELYLPAVFSRVTRFSLQGDLGQPTAPWAQPHH